MRNTVKYMAMLMLFSLLGNASAEIIQWKAIGGTLDYQRSSIYGIPEVPSAANRLGVRWQAASWSGVDGKFYIFGGYIIDNAGSMASINDLWRYDPASGAWTWLKGGNTPYQRGIYGTQGMANDANTPGARFDATAWTGADGKLYLFGGCGFDCDGNSSMLNDLWRYDAATNQWTWLKGSKNIYPVGVYGTRGVPADTNTPSPRESATAWTGADGKLYLLGGEVTNGAYSIINDFWRYDPKHNQWTWLQGSQSPDQYGIYGTMGNVAAGNMPGARARAAAWTGKDGILYLFGGDGFGKSGRPGVLNDLWRYNPATGQWTWMRGGDIPGWGGYYGMQYLASTENEPGARRAPSAWTGANGKLYLHGGVGLDRRAASGYLNDLWCYDATTNLWTWIHGSMFANPKGVYGKLGEAEIANTPGGRSHAAAAQCGGKLYLFGGWGYGDRGSNDYLNDLWRYDPASGRWTWVKGSKTLNQSGVYGTRTVAAAANLPGSRYGAASWTCTGGQSYLFGGHGYDQNGNAGELNDLWRYNPATGKWSWLKGSQSGYGAAVYGTPGVAADDNTPGSGYGSATWTGTDGRLYLFGGYCQEQNNGFFGRRNALWRYDPANGKWTWLTGSQNANPPGVYGTPGVAAAANTPGARDDMTAWIGPGGKFYLFGGEGYDSAGKFGRLNDLWRYDPATDLWTWLKGNKTVEEPGIYGIQEVAATANTPGASVGSSGWTGASGKLYLFGGIVINNLGFIRVSNEFWRYDPASNQWTFLRGNQNYEETAIYGIQGMAFTGNFPGSHFDSTAWTGADGKFYLFGGRGLDSRGYYTLLNELWRFDPALGQWTWLKGSNIAIQPGINNPQGTDAINNTPGARSSALAWSGADGKLYLFGGNGDDCSGYFNVLGDLWCLESKNASNSSWPQYR